MRKGALAVDFLQRERCRRRQTQLTLPVVRAVMTDGLSAHFLVTHPHYLEWMLKLKLVRRNSPPIWIGVPWQSGVGGLEGAWGGDGRTTEPALHSWQKVAAKAKNN